jgi:pyruvate dehydrogenase E1 component
MNDSTPHTLLTQAASANPARDPDPQETAEWREAFEALADAQGQSRARQMLDELSGVARARRIGWQPELSTPYVNTIDVNEQPVFPGDLALEERLASLMRWHALAMVVRANQAESGGSSELGGHIASYASAADLFETGFNHFFHAREGLDEGQHRGDLVFFQPHSAQGLSSYPPPYLMPDFWRFPTGSMAAMAASSTSWKSCFRGRAGTSSSWSGAATWTACLRAM